MPINSPVTSSPINSPISRHQNTKTNWFYTACKASIVVTGTVFLLQSTACTTTKPRGGFETDLNAQTDARKNQGNNDDNANDAAKKAEAARAQALIDAGDAAWEKRSDQVQLVVALQKWEEASKIAPSADVYVKLSHGQYLLGDGFYPLGKDADKRDAAFTVGLDWAEKALRLSAPAFVEAINKGKSHPDAIVLAPKDAVPAMYWYASNLGKWAAAKGFTTRVRYKDDIKATMEHIKKLDESFFYYAVYRYLGAYEASAAGLAGGDLKLSEEYFTQALAKSPNYLGTRVLWAEYLCTKNKDKALYKKLLNEVLNADPTVDPVIEQENRIEQKKAKVLLDNLDELFR